MCCLGADSNTVSVAAADEENIEIQFDVIEGEAMENLSTSQNTATAVLPEPATSASKGEDLQAGWRGEFSESADIRREFGNDEAAYIAYKQAEADGRTGVGRRDKRGFRGTYADRDFFNELTRTFPQAPDFVERMFTAGKNISEARKLFEAEQLAEKERRERFYASEDLMCEFDGNYDDYLSFKKAEASGRVQIVGSRHN